MIREFPTIKSAANLCILCREVNSALLGLVPTSILQE